MKKKTNYFFEQFVVLSQFCNRAIDALIEGMKPVKDIDVEALKNSVHTIEHASDEQKREIEERLGKEFMTPIDREDIFLLLDAIDDLTDAIDDVSYKMYVHNQTRVPEDGHDMLELARGGVYSVSELLSHLQEVTKKEVIYPLIEKAQYYEEEADHLYEAKVHDIYLKGLDRTPDGVIIETFYSSFEYITDKCRDIAKEVSIIMYKNL